ncbi:OB-fold nucleic acid binding domain-containing protein [Methanonatronarchaeum sp. AMET-Sl]|uniref:OB-fold nucleic acid binding domain-containing protein n=1 Tax=Methanonatronarchaeum sp. AMET-Sl TaxID=3037654 RepID=UPI00244DD516|nr:OB-fold nucleic acid binding domain-containing protein [Methanonatronarchaeum sp. AMET-Sl]WGI17580.1 OB-fold nucleic acid binding domain-containing protein [Methanonatronarchaeum sp. AMET-Sl]
MGIDEVYEKIKESDIEVSKNKFTDLIDQKVTELGGLCDRDTAAKLVAKDIGIDGEGPIEISEIDGEGETVSFDGKVIEVEQVRTFDRDDGSVGRVANILLGDETGEIRVVLWDEMADLVKTNEIQKDDVLSIRNAQTKEGYSGLEVNVGGSTRVEKIDSEVNYERETTKISELTPDLGNVDIAGEILDIGDLKEFTKKDGEQGKVRSIKIGDETGKIDISLWDEHAEKTFNVGDRVLIQHGYTKERYGELELSVGYRGNIQETDKEVSYERETTPLKEIEPGKQYDITANITGIQPTKTFQKKDGSNGKVKNIYLDDGTQEIRAALWNEQTEKTKDLQVGDIIRIEDARAKEGYQDDIELSIGWSSTIKKIENEIKEIQGNISKVKGGTKIDVKGTVISKNIIDDGTGCIKITNQELPQIGTTIRVKGTAERKGSTNTVKPTKIEKTHQDPEDIEMILQEIQTITKQKQKQEGEND